MKRILSIIAAAVLALSCLTASATPTTISGTSTQYPIGFLLQSGQFCFNSACATITNGVFSGTFTEGTATVTITNGAQTILSIQSVTISTSTYNWDSYVVGATAQISGMGSPTIACSVGAFYLQLGNVPNYQPWTCMSVGGSVTWVPQGPANTYASGVYNAAGVPSFSCYAPCQYVQTDASPSTQAYWLTVGTTGFPTTNWVRQNGIGNIVKTSANPYNALPTDDVILANGITNQVIVLPTIGIPVGKKYTIKMVASETVMNNINVYAGNGTTQGPTANIDAWPTTGASNFQIWIGTSATTAGGGGTLIWDGTQYWSLK